ncbi:hypothetical protein BGX34_008054 [Mortierella sp. NVP85]|nr:hypothetical protein BGX34_008054 [Mortierella sp. NVP85]
MFKAALARPKRPEALEHIRQLIKNSDTKGLLSKLSDPRWFSDAELQLALLQDYDLMTQLVNLSDVYLQFMVHKLLMVVLLDVQSPLIQNEFGDCRRALAQSLIQKLVDPQDGARSHQRTILELLHRVFKHQRHLLRHQVDIHSESTHKDHVARLVIKELTLRNVWEAIFGHLIRAAETQHTTLTLLIDIEKSWSIAGRNEEMLRSNIALCHDMIMGSLDQLLDISQFRPSTLRKLFELLCLVLGHIDEEVSADNVALDEAFRQSVYIASSFSDTTLRLIATLHDSDPQLEGFSARGTTFIHDDISVDSSINGDVATLTSCPEAIRQLGRVYLTATGNALHILLKMVWCIDGHEAISAHVQSVTTKLLSLVREWLGPSTPKVILTIYGEDDAGICWVLKTLAQIQQQLVQLHLHSHPSALSSIDPGTFDELYQRLSSYVHPTEVLFVFLESIGYDYQTLLDLLLTLDDQQSGGMLAAIMAVLRNFTEHELGQTTLVNRWRDAISTEDTVSVEHDHNSPQGRSTNEHDGDVSSSTRARLFHVEFCLAELASQIRRLQSRNLFPYNPKALLVVLDRTCAVLTAVFSEPPDV